MLNRCVAVLAAMTMLAGCASTQAVMPSAQIVDRPPLNATAEAELGDTIVEKGRVSTYEGLELRNQLTWGDGFLLKKFTVSPGKLRAQQKDAQFTYFYSDRMTVYDALLGTSPYMAGGICTKNGDPSFIRIFIKSGVCNFNPKPAPQVERVRVTDIQTPGFRQELIYNGRSGDTIKFSYREFNNDMARPPFSQDVQYDLKDGSTIGFKGLRIEVLSATNTKLSYRVLSSFPDSGG